MSLVQLVERKYEQLRVPRGERPFFEFHLDDNERIAGVGFQWTTDVERRETVDHHILVWIEVRL